MKTLYCSVHTDEKSFDDFFKKNPGKFENVAQKFHTLLSDGLSSNLESRICVLSCPPTKVSHLKLKTQKSIFYYIPILSFPIIKHIVIWLYMIVFSILWNIFFLFERKTVYISMTSFLRFFPVFVISKVFNTNLVLIVCDIPQMTFSQRVKNRNVLSYKYRISNFFFKCIWKVSTRFDYYVFLTEKMNNIINKYNKPYVIVEGFSDIKMREINNILLDKYQKNIIVYAGGLYEKYGIQLLIDAVEDLNDENIELWLMGKGELEKSLYDGKYRHVRFLGSKLNSEVLSIERKATILINPRFSNEEYTEYSFPSKTIEYMSTGTLLLTTRLKGIPEEYFNYCEVIENETVEGLKYSIQKVLNMPKELRHEKGLLARKFVLEKKNNIFQASRILMMIEK